MTRKKGLFKVDVSLIVQGAMQRNVKLHLYQIEELFDHIILAGQETVPDLADSYYFERVILRLQRESVYSCSCLMMKKGGA